MKTYHSKQTIASLVTLAVASLAVPALAQNNARLEEVIITAEKKTSTIQDTSISIASLSGEELNQQGRTDLYSVLDTVSGFTIANGPFGRLDINMRGIEGRTAQPGKSDPGVTTNFDGTYSPALLGDAGQTTFFDIDRVEVLRGPQGTLYGRNAIAGVLNIITANPTDELDMSGTFEVGNYNLIRTEGMVNLPLSDDWALRLAGQSKKRDGYYTSGGFDEDSVSGRAKLQFNNDESLRILFGAEYSSSGGALGIGGMNGGIPAWGAGDPPSDPWDDVAQGVSPGQSKDNSFTKFWTEVEWDTPIGTLSLLPSYVDVEQNSLYFVGTDPDVDLRYATTEGTSESFEARLNSNSDSNLDWVVGAFVADEHADTDSERFTRVTAQDQSSLGLFGQAEYQLTDQLSLLAGLRYSEDEKSFETYRTIGALRYAEYDKTWDDVNWKLGLNYDVSDDSMLYFSVSTGYRPGAINNSAQPTKLDIDGNEIPFTNYITEPETLTAYELGSKNDFLEGTLRVNAAIYYNDYQDMQFNYFITTADPTKACPDGTAPETFGADIVCNVLLNVDQVESFGSEIDMTWLPTDNDTLNLSLAYNDTVVGQSQDIPLSVPPGSTIPAGATVSAGSVIVDIDGETTPVAPKWTIKSWYEHAFNLASGTMAVRGDVRYVSESYMRGFNYLNPAIDTNGYVVGDIYTIESSVKYDASLRYTPNDGNWNLTVYGRNLTEEAVKSYTDGSWITVEPPRTFGVVFSASM